MDHQVYFMLKMPSHKYWVFISQITPFSITFFIISSIRSWLFNFLITYGSSSHLESAHDNVRKYVSISYCLIISSTPYKNCFQYAAVLLAELRNENALSLATNLSIFALKSFLNVPDVSLLGFCASQSFLMK